MTAVFKKKILLKSIPLVFQNERKDKKYVQLVRPKIFYSDASTIYVICKRTQGASWIVDF